MNRPTHLRQAKSYAQKLGSNNPRELEPLSRPREEEPQLKKVPTSKTSLQLYDRINKMFDDPSIKELEDYNHDDFLSKDPIELNEVSKPKSKSLSGGKDVLLKAKSLLEKKSSEIPIAKEKQKKMKLLMSQKASKENTFVTGLGLYSEQKEVEEDDGEDYKPKQTKIVEKPQAEENEDFEGDGVDDDDDDDENYDDFDENEYLKELKIGELDDLEELRRMIAATKKSIQGYAGEVFNLKNSISDLNIGYQDTGFGVDEELFSELDREFNRFMPGGDSQKIFDDIEQKVRSSQPVLSTASKKGVKKNSLVGIGLAGSTSQNSLRRPAPLARQPTLDRGNANSHTSSTPSIPTLNKLTQRVDLAPISGSTNSMRSTFY